MTIRFLTAASLLALVSACSSQPGPISVDPVDRGYDAYRAGDYRTAEQAYSSALATSPNRESAMLGLAEVYAATGRTQEAAALYRDVYAARSGSIRVWNDGRRLQEGVTEVASRRLGALMMETGSHGGATGFAPAAPMPVPPGFGAPQVDNSWPENPTYALDTVGIVTYTDPGTPQPMAQPVYQMVAEPVYQTVTEPVYQPIQAVSFAPINQPVYQPVDQRGTVYYADPVATQPIQASSYAPISQPVFQPVDQGDAVYYADPAATQPIPKPVFERLDNALEEVLQQQGGNLNVPAPQPLNYAPLPRPSAPAPAIYDSAPVFAPMPMPGRQSFVPSGVAPAAQPGYAVIDGNFVYISAEDIANRTGQAPAVRAPDAYTDPALPTMLNGIPSIDLN